jgi:hypothetical protein
MFVFVKVFNKGPKGGDHLPNLSHLKNKQFKNYNVIAMAFNTTFNNISDMSRRSVLFLVPRVPGENHRPTMSKYYDNILLC